MTTSGQAIGARVEATSTAPWYRRALLTPWQLLTPMARPWVAGVVALVVYLLRAALSPNRLRHTNYAYYNYLADAFLHGQLNLRFTTAYDRDLIYFAEKIYLYWPPFPAITLMPFVALFGVETSDILFTVVCGALAIALVAKLLATLEQTGVTPLSVERRALLVVTCAFGSVPLILAPAGGVWYSGQLVGWGCVLIAAISALAARGKIGYFMAGLALGCATATRVSLLFNGVWLAYYLLRRDRRQPLPWRIAAAAWGGVPVAAALLLLGWYNWARFGGPLETGLPWHNVGPMFRDDFERYGAFDLHYLLPNLYHHFVAHPLVDRQLWLGGGPLADRLYNDALWMGGGLFWMTPVLLGALYAVWVGRHSRLVWSLVLSCILVYIPIGLLMGTGYFTFGPRYLLDLMVPLLVLTALGIRRWGMEVLWLLVVVSCGTYSTGSLLWLIRSWSSWWL